MLTKLRICLYIALLMSSVAAASEATVKQAMQKKYPDVQVENVTKTPLAGIYEVFANGEVSYVDENVNYLIVRGRMIDIARKTDLTDERMRILTAVKFDQLPLDLAFRKVQGKGTRKVAYFADPNCSYCKKIEPDLAKLESRTISCATRAHCSRSSPRLAATQPAQSGRSTSLQSVSARISAACRVVLCKVELPDWARIGQAGSIVLATGRNSIWRDACSMAFQRRLTW